MKKLDHNETVKALREGRKITAHDELCCVARIKLGADNELYYWSERINGWVKTSGVFLNATYFTLEEPEEKHIEEWLESGGFGGLKLFYRLLKIELDKRYQKKGA